MFENIKADLQRFSDTGGTINLRIFIRGIFSQGFQAVIVYRFFHWLYENKIPSQPFRFILERFIEITTGISIPAGCEIGPGLRIHHFGGIIFHPSARLGKNVTLYHDVTIGDKGGYGGAATIDDNVLLGAGCKIIGELSIGKNSIIGANTVIVKDIPEDCIVYGNPAIVKRKK
jgi:serine O-acetyltransferase